MSISGCDDNERFNEYVREGKDINKFSDVMVFLKKLFNVDEKVVRKIKNHPHYLRVPLKDMQSTYDFLVNQQFQPTDILKALHILLYSR